MPKLRIKLELQFYKLQFITLILLINSLAMTVAKTISSLPIFLPISNFLIFWYFIMIIIIIADFYLTIISICFNNSTAEQILLISNIFVIAILFIDILFSFNTSFLKDGKIITERKDIAKNYILSRYFIIDLWAFLCALILIIIYNVINDVTRPLFLLVYLKIIKIVAFDSLIQKYILRSSSALLYYQIVKNFVLLTLVCHVFGSFFFLLDVSLINNNTYSTDYLWVYSSYCYPNIFEEPFWIQYTYSFYFVVVTLSGVAYGDLVPLNPAETAYVFMCVTFPILIFAYLFTVIYAAINERRTQNAKISRIKLLAKTRFQNLKVHHRVQHKLMNYINYYYKNKVTSEDYFLYDLAPSIRKKYKLESAQQKLDITLFSILKWDNCYDVLADMIKEEVFPQRFVLPYRENKLIYLNQGKIIQYLKLDKKYAKSQCQKGYLGAFQFFTGYTESKLWRQTNAFSLCQTIQHNIFKQYIKKNNQTLNENYCFLKDEILLYGKLDLISQRCFFCNEQTHTVYQCQHLRLKCDISNVSTYFLNRNQWARNMNFRRKNITSKKIYEVENFTKLKKVKKFAHFAGQVNYNDLYLVVRNSVEKCVTWSSYYNEYNINA